MSILLTQKLFAHNVLCIVHRNFSFFLPRSELVRFFSYVLIEMSVMLERKLFLSFTWSSSSSSFIPSLFKLKYEKWQSVEVSVKKFITQLWIFFSSSFGCGCGCGCYIESAHVMRNSWCIFPLLATCATFFFLLLLESSLYIIIKLVNFSIWQFHLCYLFRAVKIN